MTISLYKLGGFRKTDGRYIGAIHKLSSVEYLVLVCTHICIEAYKLSKIIPLEME